MRRTNRQINENKRFLREEKECSRDNNVGAQGGQNHVDCGGGGMTCNHFGECESMNPQMTGGGGPTKGAKHKKSIEKYDYTPDMSLKESIRRNLGLSKKTDLVQIIGEGYVQHITNKKKNHLTQIIEEGYTQTFSYGNRTRR